MSLQLKVSLVFKYKDMSLIYDRKNYFRKLPGHTEFRYKDLTIKDMSKKSSFAFRYSDVYSNESDLVWFVVLVCKHQIHFSNIKFVKKIF